MSKDQPNLQTQLILSQISFDQILEGLRQIVREEIRAKITEELQEKMLTRFEVCKMFQISQVTLSSWSKQDLLKEHRIGGKVYFKQSEVLQAGKSLKKYKRELKGG